MRSLRVVRVRDLASACVMHSPTVSTPKEPRARGGEIEYADVAEFMSGWLAEECDSRDGYCEGFDLDYNGMVGFYDFALFGRHWHSTD